MAIGQHQAAHENAVADARRPAARPGMPPMLCSLIARASACRRAIAPPPSGKRGRRSTGCAGARRARRRHRWWPCASPLTAQAAAEAEDVGLEAPAVRHMLDAQRAGKAGEQPGAVRGVDELPQRRGADTMSGSAPARLSAVSSITPGEARAASGSTRSRSSAAIGEQHADEAHAAERRARRARRSVAGAAAPGRSRS